MSTVNLNTAASNYLYSPQLQGGGLTQQATETDPLLEAAGEDQDSGIFQTSQTGTTSANALFQTLADSVNNALSTASGNSSVDPNQLVENAISQVIQQNSTASGQSGSLQDFLQTLQSNGVDPQQFQSDFLTAIQQAQNGVGHTATAFSSFPPGLTLDATA